MLRQGLQLARFEFVLGCVQEARVRPHFRHGYRAVVAQLERLDLDEEVQMLESVAKPRHASLPGAFPVPSSTGETVRTTTSSC